MVPVELQLLASLQMIARIWGYRSAPNDNHEHYEQRVHDADNNLYWVTGWSDIFMRCVQQAAREEPFIFEGGDIHSKVDRMPTTEEMAECPGVLELLQQFFTEVPVSEVQHLLDLINQMDDDAAEEHHSEAYKIVLLAGKLLLEWSSNNTTACDVIIERMKALSAAANPPRSSDDDY